MTFAVRYTAAAREDLKRLYRYRLDRAETIADGEFAEQALAAITGSIDSLTRTPFICRKASTDPFLRELIIQFGSSGYVALFEVEDVGTVTVLAVRHQLEDDYH